MRFLQAVTISITTLLLQPVLCGAFQGRPVGKKAKPEPGSLASSERNEAPSHFEKAEAFLKEGKFRDAIAEYHKSLEDHPENEAALFGMALAQTQAGMAEQAVLSYESALKINPQLWEAEINLGILLANQQHFEQALSHFQQALELNPKSFQAASFAARTLESLGRMPNAATSYLKALSLAASDSEKCNIHTFLGDLYLRAESWDDAERHLTAARQCQQNPAVDLELARLYLRKGEYDRSIELLQPLATRRPEDAELQELLGRALGKKGSFAAAVPVLELSLKYQQDSQRRQAASLELAEAYQNVGQTDKALQLLQATAATSNNPRLHFHLGTLYLQQRNVEGAKESFLRAVHLKPDYIECYSNLGSILMVQEKYAEALAAFSRFRVARPEVAGTYFYMGLAFDKLNDVENAFSHYGRFLDLDQGKSDKQGFQARERMKVLAKRLKRR